MKPTIDYVLVERFAQLSEMRRIVNREYPTLRGLLLKLHTEGADCSQGPIVLEFSQIMRARRSYKALAAFLMARLGEPARVAITEFVSQGKQAQWRIVPRPNLNWKAPAAAKGELRVMGKKPNAKVKMQNAKGRKVRA